MARNLNINNMVTSNKFKPIKILSDNSEIKIFCPSNIRNLYQSSFKNIIFYIISKSNKIILLLSEKLNINSISNNNKFEIII